MITRKFFFCGLFLICFMLTGCRYGADVVVLNISNHEITAYTDGDFYEIKKGIANPFRAGGMDDYAVKFKFKNDKDKYSTIVVPTCYEIRRKTGLNEIQTSWGAVVVFDGSHVYAVREEHFLLEDNGVKLTDLFNKKNLPSTSLLDDFFLAKGYKMYEVDIIQEDDIPRTNQFSTF